MTGHQVHQAAKRQFYRVEILVNICVIEFDIVDDRQLRQVVHELWPFVEISRVVFVAFDDEVIAVSYVKARAEVLHDSAHHERWIKASLIHHPGGETRRRSLAMGAGNYQRSPAADEFFLENFRK